MPASLVTHIKKMIPKISGYDGSHSKGRPIIVCHEELFFAVTIPSMGTPSYQTLNSGNGFPIQPGSNQLFPWLSSLAVNFEQYRFRRFRIKYYTRSATTTAGELAVLVDTDVNDPAAGSMVNAMSFDDRMNGPAYCEEPRSFSVLASDLHPDGNRKFIRSVTSPNTNDAKTFDAGNVWVSAEGFAASTAAVWGYLTVEYEIELWKPQVPLSVSSFFQLSTNTLGFIASPGTWFDFIDGKLGGGGNTVSSARDVLCLGLGSGAAFYGLKENQFYQMVFTSVCNPNPAVVSPSPPYISSVDGMDETAAYSSAIVAGGVATWIILLFFRATKAVASFGVVPNWNNAGVPVGISALMFLNAVEPHVGLVSDLTLGAVIPGRERPVNLRLCSERTRYALEKGLHDVRYGLATKAEFIALREFAEKEARAALAELPSVSVPPALRPFVH